jgi:hypothetical protein
MKSMVQDFFVEFWPVSRDWGGGELPILIRKEHYEHAF